MLAQVRIVGPDSRVDDAEVVEGMVRGPVSNQRFMGL